MAEILDTSHIPGTRPVNLKDDNPWVSRATGKLGGIEVPANPSPEILAMIEQAGIERPKPENQLVELAQEAHEANACDPRVQKYKIERQDELTDVERVRSLMHIVTFCRKLDNILGKDIFGASRVWLNTPPPMEGFDNTKSRGLFIKMRGMERYPYRQDFPLGWKYIGPVQVPYMSEFGILNEDAHGMQAGWKYYGWRGHALLALIMQGAITEDEANREFGKPRGDHIDKGYREKLERWNRDGKRTH